MSKSPTSYNINATAQSIEKSLVKHTLEASPSNRAFALNSLKYAPMDRECKPSRTCDLGMSPHQMMSQTNFVCDTQELEVDEVETEVIEIEEHLMSPCEVGDGDITGTDLRNSGTEQ